MKRAGLWTTTWIVVVCVAGGARLLRSTTGGVGVGSDSHEIQRAHELGVPIDASSIESAPVPIGQNAAPLYGEIGHLLKTYEKVQNEISLVPVRQSGFGTAQDDQKQRDKNDLALTQLQSVFVLADQLDAYPKCDFGHPVDAAGNPDFTPINTARSLARDLCVKADYQDRQGDWRGALKSLQKVDRVERDLDYSASSIDSLSEELIRGYQRREYEELVQRHSRDLPFLEAAGAQFASERTPTDLRKLMTASIVYTRPELRTVTTLRELRQGFGTNDSADDILTSSFLSGERLQRELDARLLAAWIDLWPKLPKDPTDWAAYRKVLKPANDSMTADNSALNSVNQTQFAMFLNAAERAGERQAGERLLADSIELLKMRLKDGKFPVVLPKTLGQDRIDPFSGESMRYRVDAAGFTLYSVGKDGVDNGGHRRQSNDPPDVQTDIVESFS